MTTPDPPPDVLTERIARMERRQRQASAVTFMLVLAIVALLAWQLYPGTRPIEGERFVMRDKHGVRRADLSIPEGYGPMLRLNDVNGKARAALQLREDGSVNLRMWDQNGEARVNLAVRSGGEPELTLMNAEGRSLVKIGMASDGRGTITVRDARLSNLWNTPD